MVKISNTYLFGKVQNAQIILYFLCFFMYYILMKYLNSKEVSDILGVNISTLKEWTDNGTINCHKTPGGHRKFTMQNVREYYKSNKKASKSTDVSLAKFEHKKIYELIKKS